jgi:phosphoenolpyruvate-protein phosphotransferase
MNNRSNAFTSNDSAFQGRSLAAGIARGKAFLLKRVNLQKYRDDTSTVNIVSVELAGFDFALHRSKDQISHLMITSQNGIKEQSLPIFDATLRLLNDPAFVSPLMKKIETTALHTESVLAEEIAHLRDRVAATSDDLTKKGLITMLDLYYRLLYNMLPSDEGRISSLLRMPAGSILIADRLAPVEVAVVPIDKVVGILIEESAQHSHASIMAQTLGIPVVMDFPGIGSLIDESTDVLIDAYRGFVFVNPSEAIVNECASIEKQHKIEEQLSASSGNASNLYSLDGVAIRMLCNASNLKDILLAHNHGVMEIGLFRSEIRYLANVVLPSDEQEAAYYTGIFGVEGIVSITVRLLDMGGDKLPVYMQMAQETDPQLGCRGIRFLLSRPDLMKKQIRAILSARRTLCVRLLLPFVTTVDDLKRARVIIDEVLAEMRITDNLPHIGIMIEVPSVALSIERFLHKVDFVCLGTNDLIQYFFAANRDQDELRHYNRFTHPAFLKMLDTVIATCKKFDTHLTVCGEMASDPVGCCLLAALDAHNLSVQPYAIQSVRKAISKLAVNVLRNSLPNLLDSDSADDVEQKIAALGIG